MVAIRLWVLVWLRFSVGFMLSSFMCMYVCEVLVLWPSVSQVVLFDVRVCFVWVWFLVDDGDVVGHFVLLSAFFGGAGNEDVLSYVGEGFVISGDEAGDGAVIISVCLIGV